MIQVHAPLEYLERYEVLWPVDTKDPTRGIVSERLLEKLVQNGEVDFSCMIVGVECFQGNAFRRRVSVSIAMRFGPRSGCRILVADATGSDESTTFACYRRDFGGSPSPGQQEHNQPALGRHVYGLLVRPRP